MRSLCLIQFQGKVTSLVKPKLALPLHSQSGCRPGRKACGRNWQRSMLAAPPALFLHQEIRFPVTQTHESAFPLSIIHSQICNSRGFRGMEERKEYSMTRRGSVLFSPHETLQISSQITLRFHKMFLREPRSIF